MSAHPEIAVTQRAVLDLVERQYRYLAGKPTPFLEDLKHEAEQAAHSPTASEQMAAIINRDAARVILDERGKR